MTDGVVTVPKGRKAKGALFTGMEKLLNDYEYLLYQQDEDAHHHYYWHRMEFPVAAPIQIRTFLKDIIGRTEAYTKAPCYDSTTGVIISGLIRKSYEAGYNDFLLDTTEFSRHIDDIGYCVRGKKDNKLRIKVLGALGDLCCLSARHIVFNAGIVGTECGLYAEDSIFNLGTAGIRCGYGVKDCSFSAETIGGHCGEYAKRSMFIAVNFGYDCGIDAENCVFRTSDNNSLRKLVASVARGKRNKIYFIEPDGKKKLAWHE